MKSYYEYLIEQEKQLGELNDNFWKWFSKSKVVDGSGQPLVVYHGSNLDFDVFDINKQKNGWLGKGFYFTDDKEKTKIYGRYPIKAYLNIRNPFIVIGDGGTSDLISEIQQKHKIEIYEVDTIDPSVTLKKYGYDGIISNHWDFGKMFSCFSPTQIKSIYNNGDWSINNPNIYK